jgi:DNA polymerase-3 subunit beta
MQTLTINTSVLRNSVSVANTFTQSEGDFIGMITLVGTDGKLEVKSSDFVQTVIFKNIDFVSSDLTNTSFNAFSVDGKKLTTVLKAAKTDEVQIELYSEKIVIKSGRSKVKIDTLANTQEIEIVKDGESFDFSSQIGKMDQILHAVAHDGPNYALLGVLLQAKDGLLNIVGTDTKRMAIASSETKLNDLDVIVPKDAVSTISKLFKGFNIEAYIGESYLTVDTETVCYQTKLINTLYPEWQRIVPKSAEQTITINRRGLKTLIEEASIFESKVKIRINEKGIVVQDMDGNTEVTDTLAVDNADMYFAVDSKAVIDFLNSFDEDNVVIAYNGANMPFVLTANSEYKEIVMPIVISDEETHKEETSHAA